MLNNIFLKTVRDYCRQVLIWGGGLGLLMLIYGFSYNSTFGTGPGRARAIEDYRKTLESFSILTGKVYDLDTYGGFLITKVGSVMPVLLGIWAVLAASALIRGEEERGSMDLLASTPHSRAALLLQKWGGFLAVLLAINILSWAGMLAGAAAANTELGFGAAATAHLNWSLAALVFAAAALLFSQLTSRKSAAGWAGGLLVASYLLNNLVQNLPSLQWSQYLYPSYYANLSQPLARSVGTSPVGISVLFVTVVVLVALALAAFERRDYNSYFEVFKKSRPARSDDFRQLVEPASPWLSNSFTFSLRRAMPGVLVWGGGMALYLLLIMSTFNEVKTSMVDLIKNSELSKQFSFFNLTGNENLLSLFIFVFLVLLVAAYAVVQVAGWTAEENEGRLEMVLSTPTPRWRLLLNYFGVALVSSAALVTLLGTVFALACWIFNITVNPANALAAFLGLWIVCAVVEAIGYVLAAFGPAWAVGATTAIVIISYFSNLFEQVLKLPEALLNLSVFRQYGQPLADGLRPIPQLIMLALSVVFIVVAVYRFRRRDISK